MPRFIVVAAKVGIPPPPAGAQLPVGLSFRALVGCVDAPRRDLALPEFGRLVAGGPLAEEGEGWWNMVLTAEDYFNARIVA